MASANRLNTNTQGVFRKFCTKASCIGVEKHFEGTCHRVQAVVDRRAKETAAYLARVEARRERHAAFLERQARREERAARDAKVSRMPDLKWSEVSTEADEISLAEVTREDCIQSSWSLVNNTDNKSDDDDWSAPTLKPKPKTSNCMAPKKEVEQSPQILEAAEKDRQSPQISERAEKDKRKVEKKLREITKIEEAVDGGKAVDKLQQQKVAAKSDLLIQLDKAQSPQISEATKKDAQSPQISEAAEKDIRKLEKKLREIAKIEAAVDSGKAVDKLQQQKVATKSDLLSQVDKIKSGEMVKNETTAEVQKTSTKAHETSKAQRTSAKEQNKPQARTAPQRSRNVHAKQDFNRASVGELVMPQAGCRVHFSGCLMFDEQIFNWCSVPYVEDQYSEYVGKGRYPDNGKAFPKAIATTFDSVAVDAGTRVTIYSEPNFKGKVLWDRVGPAIVVNSLFERTSSFYKGVKYSDMLKQEWEGPLQKLFPPEVREFSISNMHTWNLGSLVIQDGESIPQTLDDIAEYHSLPNPRY